MWIYNGISIQNKRQQNMDSVMISERQIGNEKIWLATLCDGVGSTEFGAGAASLTTSILKEWFDSLESSDCLGIRFRNCIMEINRRIAETWNTGEMRAATTLSALVLFEDRYYLVHIGDSRIYAVSQTKLEQMTIDHKEHGSLTQYLGMRSNIMPQYREGSIPETAFLLCSDGFYQRMDFYRVFQIIKESGRRGMKNAMERAVREVVRSGETDNISLAVLKRKSEEKNNEQKNKAIDCQPG